MKHTYFETKYLKLEFDEQEECAIVSWLQFPLSSEFRTGMNTVIELMRDKHIGKVLGDTRPIAAIAPEDQDWSIQDWLPRAFAVGYRRIALVISEDIFNQMSVEDIMNRVDGVDFASKYFPSLEEGRAWLATQ